MHPGELWTHNPVPFLTGENWVSIFFGFFFIADGNIPKFDCVECLWNVTTSRILHGDSLDSLIRSLILNNSTPPCGFLLTSVFPDQVIQMLSYRIMKCFSIGTLRPPFPCPRICLALELMWSTGKSKSRRGFALLGWSSRNRNAGRGSWEVEWRSSALEK